ncbi:MAG: class I mannose-6-phosphate isomerase, partial [Lachnospiraceae bacterium]|nr:class I mannose-6-phosphate isomerase [Lachnospiraceae bacterium]
MKELLLFEPLCKERIWGSETWTVSALPEGDLKVSEGSYAGETLSGLWKDHRELFGRGKGELFPLLVKVIDAKSDLSIQVHPDDTYAKAHENGACGKAESWYIMDVTEGNTLVLGHHAKTREQAREMVQSGRWNEFIRQVPVEAGELVQIDPGTIHAIHGGTKITEIQQSSDIT